MNESAKSVQVVVPDFNMIIKDGNIEITLNGRNAPELKVSREYKNMMQTYSESKKTDKSQKEALMFVKQKLDSAK